MAVVATAIVLAVVAGVVTARALGPWGSGRGPAASAASAATRPAASSSAPSADAGEAAAPTEKATPTPRSTPEPAPTPKPRFVVNRALSDVRALEDIGVRSAGGGAEKRGAAFIAGRLVAAGAQPETRTFRLPNGKTSRNVVARFPGSTRKTIILGAHMDSKAPSPGANDNGSGCGALLEIARCLGRRQAYPTVELVFFGAEEMIDANPDHHHFGSRYHVKHMSAGARKNAAGMISVDMIGYGPHFVVRTMGNGPQSLRRLLLRQARERGIRMSYLRDPGESGWSDHEAFELAGIPAAWIEWRDDPVYHTSADTSGHLVAAKVRTAGQFVLGVLYGLDAAALERLAL
ncbi:MAG: M28 family peptidase [Actinobacteria bacterium]|nr:M28 family peptidase [Actinomycetota bacterium]